MNTRGIRILFPNVINLNLLRAVKDMVLYQTDNEYKAEKERHAAEATAGNVTYAEAIGDKYVSAGKETGLERKAIENILSLSPEYFVAKQLASFGTDELAFYLTGLSLSSDDKSKIIAAYNDIKYGKSDKVKFLQTL